MDRLISEGISFESQFAVRSGHIIDFAIMSKKVAIETDGEAWHSSKKAKKRDGFKNYMLKRQGWTILRFTGKEVENDMDSVIKKIKESLDSKD